MLSLSIVDIEEALVRSIGNEAKLVNSVVTKSSWPLSSAAQFASHGLLRL